MLVKLVLSLDRREDAAAALETVHLAHRLRTGGGAAADLVVGIDLCGNPAVGELGTWLPALEKARELGMKITLHGGEVPNEVEVARMLEFKPDRFGHMCCLSAELEEALWGSGIPVELVSLWVEKGRGGGGVGVGGG